MQDHLYKDHVELEKEYTRQLDLHKAAEKEAKDQLNLQQVEKQKLSDAISLIKSSAGPDDLKGRVVDLTKQNALLEINLIRMTRKYQTLEQQEQLLRRNYQSMEQDMSDMEVACTQRINQLTEWKRKATFQLK